MIESGPLLKFRNGSHRLLITTDLASRGLDIPEIEYVVHYQLPHNEEAFLHRNGRTARMHAKGTSYLLLTEDEKLDYLQQKPELRSCLKNRCYQNKHNGPLCILQRVKRIRSTK